MRKKVLDAEAEDVLVGTDDEVRDGATVMVAVAVPEADLEMRADTVFDPCGVTVEVPKRCERVAVIVAEADLVAEAEEVLVRDTLAEKVACAVLVPVKEA